VRRLVRKILVILGTRPEAIKLAPVIESLRRRGRVFRVRVCSTGQHARMLDQVLRLFDIRLDYDLRVMRPDQSLSDLTARILRRLQSVFKREQPDFVLVQGDTTTALASALAAYYHQAPLGHVEAGLRTEDKRNPYPEEGNRRLIADLADLHFAPTPTARRNLLRNGVPASRVFVTGNTVVDALRQVVGRWKHGMTPGVRQARRVLDRARRQGGKRIILTTCHRRETFGRDLANVCRALIRVARSHPDVVIIYPLHLNPRVRTIVRRLLGRTPNIHLIEPLSYESVLFLMSESALVLTDSGGVQEEAPSLGKPALVMRRKTERPEGIRRGLARLVGTSTRGLVCEVERFLRRRAPARRARPASNPYGTGDAARRIAHILEKVI
jgi:UDP-N-acetylglucosamine 2-epimerase (non-hydrolysing)